MLNRIRDQFPDNSHDGVRGGVAYPCRGKGDCPQSSVPAQRRKEMPDSGSRKSGTPLKFCAKRCVAEDVPPRAFFVGNYILNFFLFFLLHSTILSACQYVGSTAPTVRSIRKAPLVLVYDRGPSYENISQVGKIALAISAFRSRVLDLCRSPIRSEGH